METRKVTIINSKTQSQKVIENSTATNLGELKAEMRAAGIDYSGMTFYEGHLRAELKDDASPLPTNIPYKGTTVNDLVFMLTTPEKKVRSGAMSRAEAYAAIKERGLQEACKNAYGKNFTQCSTDALVELLSSYEPTQVEPAVVEPAVIEPVMPVETVPTAECGCANVKKAMKALLDALYGDDTIGQETYYGVTSLLEGKDYVAPKKMSQNDIKDMFDFIKD